MNNIINKKIIQSCPILSRALQKSLIKNNKGLYLPVKYNYYKKKKMSNYYLMKFKN